MRKFKAYSEETSKANVKKAIAIATKYEGNMTKAYAEIEKLSPDVIDHPDVQAALKIQDEGLLDILNKKKTALKQIDYYKQKAAKKRKRLKNG